MTTSRRRRRRGRPAAPAAGGALALWLAVSAGACSPTGEAGAAGQGADGSVPAARAAAPEPYARVINVEVERIRPRPFRETIRLTGTVAANRDVTLSAEETGTVRSLLVEKGDRVRRGEPLLRLDSRLLQAQLREARAQEALARETWQRNRRLFEEERAISQLAYLQTR